MNTTTVEPWPVQRIGDEFFAGYICGLGYCESGDKAVPVADFQYDTATRRYRLPTDTRLLDELFELVKHDMLHGSIDGVYSKLWIRRTANGYKVSLP